jgi:hypothetical protein
MILLMKIPKRALIILSVILIVSLLGACGTATLVPIVTETAMPNIQVFTSSITAFPIYTTPSPLPTQLTVPVTLNPTQTKQQNEIKDVIHAYFDLRYQVLSVSPPNDFQINGFGDLVSDGPDARDFLVTEMAKLSVERKWIELNRFGYAKYEYSLTYKDIAIDASAQIATISVLEDFTIVTERAMERNPEKPSITKGDLTHEIILQNEQGQWKIISDIYQDAWWRSYRKPGMSIDEILNKINARLRKLETMPSATPWLSPTP